MTDKVYYFISDLHIGGDGALNKCHFKKELTNFLKKIQQEKNAELIILGDFLGMWELTEEKPENKLIKIIKSHKEIFKQLKETGEKIKITVIAGNHDHELICFKENKVTLRKYNIFLENKVNTTRKIQGKKIWVEHGHQQDDFNRISDLGNPYATPPGYYLVKNIVGTASKKSEFGKRKWLENIESVYPAEHTPFWMYSNYFYKEMNPLIKSLVVPFLVLLFLTIIFISIRLASYPFTHNLFDFKFSNIFGKTGFIFDTIILINSILLGFILFFAFSLYFIFKDINKMFSRYSIDYKGAIRSRKENSQEKYAKNIFKNNKNVVAFIYGHTHNPYIKKIDGKLIINTGTWLKKLKRLKSRLKVFPSVYYPYYRLNYFKIHSNKKQIYVDYFIINKDTNSNLTYLEKLMIAGKKKEDTIKIPSRTVIEF